MKNFLVAHISDLHYPVKNAFKIKDIFTKRITGQLNLLFSKERVFKPEILEDLLKHLRTIKVNHIVVTGDISNLSYPEEFLSVRKTFENYGFSPNDVTIIPGNHDAYLKSAFKKGNFWKFLKEYAVVSSNEDYPFVREIEDISIIGLSSAIPTFWGMAYGKLEQNQLKKLDRLLEKYKDKNPLILIHHPPHEGLDSWHDMLIDGDKLLDTAAKHKVKLILFGHEHYDSDTVININGHDIRLLGIRTAMSDSKDQNYRAGAEIIRFDDGKPVKKWTIVHQKKTNHWKTINTAEIK